jgi:hypothetical protein
MISVTDHGIVRVVGNHGRFWNYNEIESCGLVSEQIADKTVTVLVIKPKRGMTTVLGIDRCIVLDELAAVLSSYSTLEPVHVRLSVPQSRIVAEQVRL